MLPEVSPETALLAYKVAYAALIAGGVFVLGGTLLLFWSDGELKRHDNLRLSANETETAGANEAAGEANREAAKAIEKAAELEKEAEALKADVAKSNERAAALEKEAEEAKLAHERLKSQLAGRRLTQNQHDVIVEALSGQPAKVSVIHPDDTEAALFATDIAQTLRDAGWEVEESTGFYTKPPLGVIVSHASQTSIEAPHPLARALAKAGIGVAIEPGNNPTELKLTVGARQPAF